MGYFDVLCKYLYTAYKLLLQPTSGNDQKNEADISRIYDMKAALLTGHIHVCSLKDGIVPLLDQTQHVAHAL